MMEFGELIIVLISTIGTAVWSVLTWTEQQEKERKAEQDQIDALYINPFLLSAEELQSLLYSILAEDEIEFYRREISHEGENEDEITFHEALEIAYVIIKYFGWAWYFYRYGSYTQDKIAIELTRNISETFADRQNLGHDVFRCSFTKQRSLGQMFVRRLSDTNSSYPEFKATPLYQFAQEIIDSKNQNDYLYQEINKTIEAIRHSWSVEDLPGRSRLIQVQNQLVDLLDYIESKEGFSVSSHKRKKTKLVGNTITVYESTSPEGWEKLIQWLPLPIPSGFFPGEPSTTQTTNPRSLPQIVHKTRGRLRLRIPRLFGNEPYAEQLRSLIQPLGGVESIQVNQGAASVIIYYNDSISETDFERTLLETIHKA